MRRDCDPVAKLAAGTVSERTVAAGAWGRRAVIGAADGACLGTAEVAAGGAPG